MKKLLPLAAIAALFIVAIAGCKKDNGVVPSSSAATTTLKENGHTWEGWDIHHPVAKFDTVEDRILINTNLYYYNNATAKATGKALQGLALPNSGPQTVYAVETQAVGNLNTVRADLERRGYTVAPLSYFIALAKEYGVSWGNNTALWNMLCLDLPTKLNFGTGPEDAGVMFNSNLYGDQTGVYYNMSLNFFSESNSFGPGQRVLCLKK